MFYLTTHSTHFIYGYMASDIWLRTIQIARQETRYCENNCLQIHFKRNTSTTCRITILFTYLLTYLLTYLHTYILTYLLTYLFDIPGCR